MKAQEVHKLSDEEITVELRRLSRKLFDLRSQSVTEKVEDVSQFEKMRRDIARLQTERRARQIAEQPAEKTAATQTATAPSETAE